MGRIVVAAKEPIELVVMGDLSNYYPIDLGVVAKVLGG